MKRSKSQFRLRPQRVRTFVAEQLEHRLLLTSDTMVTASATDEVDHAGRGQIGAWLQVQYTAGGQAYYFDPAAVEPECQCGQTACPACSQRAADTVEETAATLAIDQMQVGLDEIPVYNSNPGAPHSFYIDFNGQIVEGTDWNENDAFGNGNDGNPIHAAPYDTDGDRTSFSETELDAIYEIWQRVSEDFLPFNINVTTEEPDSADFQSGRKANRAIVTTNVDDPTMGGTGKVWFPNAGGVAAVASYWVPGDTPAWVFQNGVPPTPKAIAEAVSHEFGHTVGLSHRGYFGAEYHPGVGEGETSWAPIMGAGYTSNVTQWTNGDYVGGSPGQLSDFDIMTDKVFGIQFREDDHGQANEDSTPLRRIQQRVRGEGIIETNTDYDVFSFDHLGGPVRLSVTPASLGPNLDVLIELYDDSSNFPILESAPEDTLSASLETELPPGTYYLLVDGGGHSPDVGEGYSGFGSIGSYRIDGVLGEPELTAIAGDGYVLDEGNALHLDASLSYGQHDALDFAWDIDGDGEFDDASGPTPKLTWKMLESLDMPIRDQGSYDIQVRVTDIALEMTAEDITSLVVHNVAPTVTLRVPDLLHSGIPIRFESETTDIAADPLTYEWRFGDGNEPIANHSSTTEHVFSRPGSYVVEVLVTDDEGASTGVRVEIEVVESVPAILATSLADGDVVGGFPTISFDFDQDLSASVSTSALRVIDKLTGKEVDNTTLNVHWQDVDQRAEFTGLALQPGLYEVILDGVTNAAGVAVDGSGDGQSGGPWSAEFTVTFAGDVDYDLNVDFGDFLVLAANFGSVAVGWHEGDFDGDGMVTFEDFLLLATNFGASS